MAPKRSRDETFDGQAPSESASLVGDGTVNPKVMFITGISGQDGSYLAELGLKKGYQVHGLIRRSSSFNTQRLHHLYKDPHEKSQLHLHYGDLLDATNLTMLLARIRPAEIYNLGAQSHVKVSFEMPEYTADVDALGTLRLLEAIRACGLEKMTKFYQASTSELYGLIQEPVQSETTPFHPQSPYAIAKQFAYWMVKNYREAYGMFAVNGILFNHESPRRGPTFVTRKITRAVAAIKLGKQSKLYLGNLDAQRDWGHAADYVIGMWDMLQADEPDDYVLATGETHSVREFVERSFACINVKIEWKGEGVDEKGVDAETGEVKVEVDPRYFRPCEVELLLGDRSKAEAKLGWKPRTSFPDLVKEMVAHDIVLMQHGDHN